MNKIIRDCAILVALHKEYDYPLDKGYFPMQLGKATSTEKLCLIGDDSNENISHLNPYFSELTGLYWLWKNVEANYYGLVHYRRYFKAINSSQSTKVINKRIASSQFLISCLDNYDIVVPKQRNYYIESIERHYGNAHYENDLKKTTELINKQYPNYINTWNHFLSGSKLSLYNMFVMREGFFRDYCEWLFPLLFQLSEKIDYLSYDRYQRRVFGFIAERLFNLWIIMNVDPDRVCYLPVLNIEGENKILKGVDLLQRKFFGRK